MTKVRVHELAKELGMENKELLDLLQKKNIVVKNHMSTLDEEVAGEIRKERAGQAEKKEEKTEGDSAAASAEKTDGAHKKKNLAYVIRPQNSRNSGRIQGNRQNQRGQRMSQGGTRPSADARQARQDRPARPAQAGRPAGERPVRPERGDRPVRPSQPSAENRPVRPAGENRPVRPAQASAGTGRRAPYVR